MKDPLAAQPPAGAAQDAAGDDPELRVRSEDPGRNVSLLQQRASSLAAPPPFPRCLWNEVGPGLSWFLSYHPGLSA